MPEFLRSLPPGGCITPGTTSGADVIRDCINLSLTGPFLFQRELPRTAPWRTKTFTSPSWEQRSGRSWPRTSRPKLNSTTSWSKGFITSMSRSRTSRQFRDCWNGTFQSWTANTLPVRSWTCVTRWLLWKWPILFVCTSSIFNTGFLVKMAIHMENDSAICTVNSSRQAYVLLIRQYTYLWILLNLGTQYSSNDVTMT